MRPEDRRQAPIRRLAALLAALVGLAGVARAETRGPDLAFPAACEPGRDCWIFHYVDHDPGRQARDYACGKRSYDGHDGTDIAVSDLAAVQAGVAVLAAAPGTVRNVRDGLPDTLYDPARPGAVPQRECGNGVAIRHSDGWETQYCHLRNGSVRVKPGDRVDTRQPIGSIGLSGQTQFPHLHFEVRWNDRSVDPFLGPKGDASSCSLGRDHLWNEAALDKVAYSPVDIYQVGFAAGAPKPADAYAGRLNDATLPVTAPALVAWATLAAVRNGDRLSIRLLDPHGRVLMENARVLEKDQVRYFGYAGVKVKGTGWPAGRYRAEVRLERTDGPTPVTRAATETLIIR